MSDVHSGPFHPPARGVCGWRHHFSGVDLDCRDQAIPTIGLCADHFIALAHRRERDGIEAKP